MHRVNVALIRRALFEFETDVIALNFNVRFVPNADSNVGAKSIVPLNSIADIGPYLLRCHLPESARTARTFKQQGSDHPDFRRVVRCTGLGAEEIFRGICEACKKHNP